MRMERLKAERYREELLTRSNSEAEVGSVIAHEREEKKERQVLRWVATKGEEGGERIDTGSKDRREVRREGV